MRSRGRLTVSNALDRGTAILGSFGAADWTERTDSRQRLGATLETLGCSEQPGAKATSAQETTSRSASVDGLERISRLPELAILLVLAAVTHSYPQPPGSRRGDPRSGRWQRRETTATT